MNNNIKIYSCEIFAHKIRKQFFDELLREDSIQYEFQWEIPIEEGVSRYNYEPTTEQIDHCDLYVTIKDQSENKVKFYEFLIKKAIKEILELKGRS